MDRRRFLATAAGAAILPSAAASDRRKPVAGLGSSTPGRDLQPIPLPAPRTEGGGPVMEMLSRRRSSRDFDPRELPDQVVSNVLWAAFGVNRPDSGGRTAPTAMGANEIDVYVVRPAGIYVYDAGAHALNPIVSGDARPVLAGPQTFVTSAPLCLVYVDDHSKYSGPASEPRDALYTVWGSIAAGCVTQNVYLVCASEGLNAVVRYTMDRPAFAQLVDLRDDQQITVNQIVGYPPA